jgi:hypothetical protein
VNSAERSHGETPSEWILAHSGILLGNLAVFGVGAVIIDLVFGSWFNPNNPNRLNLIKPDHMD